MYYGQNARDINNLISVVSDLTPWYVVYVQRASSCGLDSNPHALYVSLVFCRVVEGLARRKSLCWRHQHTL